MNARARQYAKLFKHKRLRNKIFFKLLEVMYI